MNKKTIKKNVTTFTMRIDRGIKQALEEAARQDRRSLASLLEKIGVDYLKIRGISWVDISQSDCKIPVKNI